VTAAFAIDIPIELVPAERACTAGYVWCDRDCQEKEPVEPGDEAWQSDGYHRGPVAYLSMLRSTHGGWKDLNDVSLIVRHDENEGDDSQPLILIDYPVRECTPGMTAQQARQNAAWLMTAADILDPLPAGVMATTAVGVRIGDELLTGDGWQKVTGLAFFADIEQASVFTPEREPEVSDGWPLSFNDPVKVRRPMHGAEPPLTHPERIVLTAPGWCGRCQAERVITGPRTVSMTGVMRIRGRCQTCNKKGQNAFLGLASWAVDAR